MNTETITIIIAILSSGAISAFVSGLMVNRRTKAEARSIDKTVDQRAIELAETTYKSVITLLESQVKIQSVRITMLEANVAEFQHRIDLLTKQVEQLKLANASLLEKNAELHKRIKQLEDNGTVVKG